MYKNLGLREYLKLEEDILVSEYSNCEHLRATISGFYFGTPNFNLPATGCITLFMFHSLSRVLACRKLHESRATISFWWLGQTLSDRLQYLMVPKQQLLNSLRGMPVLSFPSANIVQSCWANEFNWGRQSLTEYRLPSVDIKLDAHAKIAHLPTQ